MEKRINCRKVKKILPLYFDQNITPELQEQTEAHIASCPKCAKEKAQWEKTVGLLRSINPVPLPEGAEERLHNRLVEYVSKKRVPEEINSLSRFRWPVPFLSGVAVSALILIIAGTFIFQKSLRGNKFPITNLPEQVLNINQDTILEFGVKVKQPVEKVNVEINLPDSIRLVRDGQVAVPSQRIISWKEGLIQGENIFSICVIGIKQGNWQIKLKIKNCNLSRNVIMPVKISKPDIKI